MVSSDAALPGLKPLAVDVRWSKLAASHSICSPSAAISFLAVRQGSSPDTRRLRNASVAQLAWPQRFSRSPPSGRGDDRTAPWLLQTIGIGTVVDAYCGGRHRPPVAVALMRSSASNCTRRPLIRLLQCILNGLDGRCRFLAGDVADLLAAVLPGADALVLDPPRRGLDQRVVTSILENPPAVLAYLSCDPATQARDLKALMDPQGVYRLHRIQPVDFFPQTTHLESLALLMRINSAGQP